MPTPTIEDLQAQIGRLQHRIEHLEEQLRQKALRPVRSVAEEENQWPNSYSGLIALMEREGVPKRTRGGRLKEEGSRKTTFVSMFELREGAELATQSVRREAGRY